MWGRLLLIGGIQQGVSIYQEHVERQVKYQMAKAQAETVGKPLLVVGGPYGGSGAGFRSWFRMPSHGWGDVCMDLDPDACAGCSNCQTIEADVRDIPFSDGYFGASFVSHVIEHLPTIADAEVALGELNRVSNKVFVAGPSKTTLWAWINPDHHLWVDQLQDGSLKVEQRTR